MTTNGADNGLFALRGNATPVNANARIWQISGPYSRGNATPSYAEIPPLEHAEMPPRTDNPSDNLSGSRNGVGNSQGTNADEAINKTLANEKKAGSAGARAKRPMYRAEQAQSGGQHRPDRKNIGPRQQCRWSRGLA